MRERYYSLREFAKKAGVSPQRLSELVKKGVIKASDSGMIPAGELEYFIREQLKKELKRSFNSRLCILIGKSEEEVSAIKNWYNENLQKEGSRLVEVSSITELEEKLKEEKLKEEKLKGESINNKIDNEAMMGVLLYTKFKKELLKELVKRTQEAAFRCINKYADTEAVGSIPLRYVYELLMYQKVYSCDVKKEEEYLKVLTTGVSEDKSTTLYPRDSALAPMVTMNTSFNSIVRSLGLFNENGVPFVSRKDLTPEIITAINAMSADLIIPKGDFFEKFFSPSVYPKMNGRTREKGSEANKILASVKTQMDRANRSVEVFRISNKGFYTFVNITEDFPNNRITSLAGDVIDGYYKTIEIFATPEEAAQGIPEPLLGIISAYQTNRSVTVKILPAPVIDSKSSEKVSS